MALKLENEFVVAAPVEPTWKTLLDLQRVATCLPGAKIEPADEEGVFHGSMRVKLGPVSMDYKGTAKIVELDEAARRAVFLVQGKETRGQGSATATITNRLVSQESTTRVEVETELSVTGRPAQFGRGIMQDVAAAMLGDFAKRLSELMTSDASGAQSSPTAQEPAGEVASSTAQAQPASTRAAAAAPETARQPEALKVGGVVWKVLFGRMKHAFSSVRRRRAAP